jgi:Type VI secretion system/phage-baseplate injector OB domain
MSNGFNNQAEDESTSLQGRRFQGLVVDNNDPLQKQRIKVSIPSLMEGELEELPWVGPGVQSSFGMTGTAATVGVPAMGAVVMVTFQDGDLNYGMYDGSLHTETTPIPGPLSTNYPDRRGWVDPAGNICWIDVTGGSVEFHLEHVSGTSFHVDNDGNVLVQSVKKVEVLAAEEIRATAPKIYLN